MSIVSRYRYVLSFIFMAFAFAYSAGQETHVFSMVFKLIAAVCGVVGAGLELFEARKR